MQSRAYYVVFNMSLFRYCPRKRLKRNSKKSFLYSFLLVQHFLIMWYLFLLFSFLNVILLPLSVSGQPFATVSSSCADKLTVRSSSSGIIFSNRDGAYAHDVSCSWSIFSSTNVEPVSFRYWRKSRLYLRVRWRIYDVLFNRQIPRKCLASGHHKLIQSALCYL